ncbi:MAG: tRNA (adenosine(37)-N6)-threonylcarbamoyltransferase complex ATPase subunit type 1 TsaE [Phycisphaerales bacterium]|nr:tRNA (adenosine(37)-N6)-threonylcarbamoyltransferase complex ATPase subunit type 1 TsaE [Phycisphaerales bacterium]
MITVERDSSCEAYTQALGVGLASLLRGGDAIALVGGLGAGKTTLTRAIVRGLGGNERMVSSPTFVVINQYDLPAASAGHDRGIHRIAHIDAYRLSGSDELDALGWDRYFGPGSQPLPDVAAIIEWPEKLGDARPPTGATIAIDAVGPSSRRVAIELPDTWTERPGLDKFLEREPARCRITGTWIAPTHPSYPFADARARDADLHRWFSGEYRISRDAKAEDLESDA